MILLLSSGCQPDPPESGNASGVALLNAPAFVPSQGDRKPLSAREAFTLSKAGPISPMPAGLAPPSASHSPRPEQDLPPLPMAAKVHGMTGTAGKLWLASGQALRRYHIKGRALTPTSMALQGTAAQIVAARADQGSVYLDLTERGKTVALVRHDTAAGVVSTLALAGPLGPWQVADGKLWYIHRVARDTVVEIVGMGGGGWLEGMSGAAPASENPRLPALTGGAAMGLQVVGITPAFARSVPVRSGMPSVLAVNGDTVLVGTEDGALMGLDLATNRWHTRLSGGVTGGGRILDVVPYGAGFAASTDWLGLLWIPPDGPLEPLTQDSSMELLTVDGSDLWGIDGGRLVRYDARLGRRVLYDAPESLELAVGLVAGASGVWVATPTTVYQVDLPSGHLVPVLEWARPSVVEDRPSEREIEDIIRVIAKLTPPARSRAYARILADDAPGYEEVFLVGLNEDDPLNLELVTEYFRVHHPTRAIEPLLEVLLFIQGDAALRGHVAGVIQSFGPEVITPVIHRLEQEAPEVLAGGARRALEATLVRVLNQGGAEVLNQFLAQTSPEGLMIYGAAEGGVGPLPQIDGETFRILARRLGSSRDRRVVEGGLRVVSRLARHPQLPESVSELVPAILRHINGRHRRWALYALALVGDERATAACLRVAATDPRHRFWAIQALAATGDPRALPAIVSALTDRQPEVRAAAAFLMRSELVLEGAQALRERLVADQGELCISCVDALTTLRDQDSASVLEARLPSARREAQAGILQALLTLGGEALAQRIQGWVEVELLAPARVGRLSLGRGASRDVLNSALALIAVDGGRSGLAFVRRVAQELGDEAGSGPTEALLLGEAMPAGLSPILRRAVLGKALPAVWAGVPFPRPGPGLSASLKPVKKASARAREALARIDSTSFSALRPLLSLLVPRKRDGQTREALEAILLHAVSPQDREEAAQALFALGNPASVPALVKALRDPHFEDGPFPLYHYPVRKAAARALQRLGVQVHKGADRRYAAML